MAGASRVVTASDYGGPGDPSSGSDGYRGDNLYQHPDTFAELNMGTALGGLPYMAPVTVTYKGKSMTLYKRDIGRGGPGLNGHVRAIDLWFQAAQQLGFSGLDDVTVTLGASASAGASPAIPGAAPATANPTAGSTLFSDQHKSDLKRSVLWIAMVGVAAFLIYHGLNRTTGGAVSNTVKKTAKRAAVVVPK